MSGGTKQESYKIEFSSYLKKSLLIMNSMVVPRFQVCRNRMLHRFPQYYTTE